MEPLVLSAGSRHRPALTDLALALASRSAGLRRSLPEGIVTALAGPVRSMNCYYSNLIEGHDTHPIEKFEAILYRGEIPRGEVPRTLDLSERTANRVVAGLVERGALTPQTPKAPLRITFPATLASYEQRQ